MFKFLQKPLNFAQALTAAMYTAMAFLALLIITVAVLPAQMSGYVIRELLILIGASSLVGLAASPMAIIETWRLMRTKQKQCDEYIEEHDDLTGAEYHEHFGGR